MKKKEFEFLCKKLLPHLPGFACKGCLLYAEPIGHFLRGFCCDGSGFDPDKFAVTVFFLPLYVPTKHIHFNMGHRLKDERGCDKWWNLHDAQVPEELLGSIQRQGLPFLMEVGEPRNVATAIRQLGGNADPYRLEAIAFSLAMADEYVEAQAALDLLVKTLDTNIRWQGEMFERARELEQKLQSSAEIVKLLLAEWERGTIKNLGL